MLLGGDVAKHGGSESSNVGNTNGRSDVVVSGGDIGGKRSQGVERSFMAPFQLVAHVLGNLVKGNVTRSFVHDLDIHFPGTKSAFTLSLELGELGFVIGIVNGSRAKSISNRKGNIGLGTDVKNIIPVLVGEVFHLA